MQDAKFKQELTALLAKYPQYYKDVSDLDVIDIYRILVLYLVTDPCIAHAAKKLLLSGVRTGGKPAEDDITEARDTLNRYLLMRKEEVGCIPREPSVMVAPSAAMHEADGRPSPAPQIPSAELVTDETGRVTGVRTGPQ